MIINPFRAYRLAAEAGAAFAERDTSRQFASDLIRSQGRLLADLNAARNERDAALAKIDRMTGNLLRGPKKVA